MQEGRSAAEVAQNKERFFDRVVLVSREEDIVEPEEKPVHRLPKGPDDVEQEQEGQSFFCEMGGGVF